MNKTMKSLAAFAAITLSSAAQATLFNITSVESGSSGFGASAFHDASGSNPMSGSQLADTIEAPGFFGTYDDATGFLNGSGFSLVGGGSFTLTGTLVFDINGLLSANSMLDLDFTGGPGGAVSDTTIGFLPGYICCGNTDYDPNSFKANGSEMWMTLWGADFSSTDANGAPLFAGDYSGSALGMDIRLAMTEASVPEPSILALLSLGLFGIFMTGRNKKA